MVSRRATVAALVSLAVACEPSFKPEGGSLTIDGAPFRPEKCYVLAGDTGIALSDASGARLELTIPPQRLDAFREINGTARARYGLPEKLAADLGECGTLMLRGEGYHAQSKRAASGRMALSCSGSANVQGDLAFAGCF